LSSRDGGDSGILDPLAVDLLGDDLERADHSPAALDPDVADPHRAVDLGQFLEHGGVAGELLAPPVVAQELAVERLVPVRPDGGIIERGADGHKALILCDRLLGFFTHAGRVGSPSVAVNRS
jgi:hypothetical protein